MVVPAPVRLSSRLDGTPQRVEMNEDDATPRPRCVPRAHRLCWPPSPTYDVLAGVLRAHIANIPFESFDVLLGRPIRLDSEGLQAKIVDARRGGYCFEHASLMYAALEAIGFAPVRHSSRVLLFEPRHESVRQHMFLTVTDRRCHLRHRSGVRPFRMPQPIPIDGAPVPTGAPTHRLSREGNDWFLYVTRDGEQIQGWVSTMEEEYPVDFEMMNHYIATHPASFFTHNILASAVTQKGRVNIMNQDVQTIRNGAAEAAVGGPESAARARRTAFRLRSFRT